MERRRFLVRFAQAAQGTPEADLQQLAMAGASATGCSVSILRDLSRLMGEPCCAVELAGSDQAITDTLDQWGRRGLRIDDADREVHELEPPRNQGAPQADQGDEP